LARVDCLFRIHSQALRRSMVAAAVICAHALWLYLLVDNSHRISTGSSGITFENISVELLPIESSAKKSPAHVGRSDLKADTPDPQSVRPDAFTPEADVPAATMPEEKSEPGPVYHAPQIDSAFVVDSARFAREAGLPEGQRMSVVLAIEVGHDGTVTRVSVSQSSGDPRIDRAASAYAQELHWIAGSIDGQPRSLWTQLTVTLTGA